MTFIVSSKGVNNTEGTTAKFGSGGTVTIGGDFQNTGSVEIDLKANLKVLGSVVNAGTFSVKDYVAENQYPLFEEAIRSLQGSAKEYLQYSYRDMRNGDLAAADGWFKKFIYYTKDHPELVTSSAQVLLQIFYR
ncbi:MAG: hypothetical protein AAB391_03390 [Patescibacteria group bacterium]